MSWLACLLTASMVLPLVGPGLGPPAPPGRGDPLSREEALRRILAAAFPEPDTALPAGGRELFLAVVGSAAFEHAQVGPFDLHAYRRDGLKAHKTARKVLADAAEGLLPVTELLARRFPEQAGATGVIAGRRFPIVLASSDAEHGESAFDELLALLDHCEDLGFSEWKPFLPVWTPERRGQGEAANWEVKLFNLAHSDVKQHGRGWSEHALGYLMLSHLVDRLFAKGAWGPVPPWLRQGLVDELDIEAHGSAWVAAGESMSFRSQTAGWSRQGWEGFLPQGQAPPPPVTGPPPNLPTSYQSTVTSDTWMNRGASTTRHWTELASDRREDVPAAFRLMAGTCSYSSRDRAYARCVLHLLLELAPPAGPDLLALLDREGRAVQSGLRDSDPLSVLFARALGGVPAVDAMEAQTLEQQLSDLGRTDLLERIRALSAEPLLEIGDHRAQGEWLYHRPKYSTEDRLWLFTTIQEVEALQELREWEVLGATLDQAADAALRASSSYPKTPKAAVQVAESFRGGLQG